MVIYPTTKMNPGDQIKQIANMFNDLLPGPFLPGCPGSPGGPGRPAGPGPSPPGGPECIQF